MIRLEQLNKVLERFTPQSVNKMEPWPLKIASSGVSSSFYMGIFIHDHLQSIIQEKFRQYINSKKNFKGLLSRDLEFLKLISLFLNIIL